MGPVSDLEPLQEILVSEANGLFRRGTRKSGLPLTTLEIYFRFQGHMGDLRSGETVGTGDGGNGARQISFRPNFNECHRLDGQYRGTSLEAFWARFIAFYGRGTLQPVTA